MSELTHKEKVDKFDSIWDGLSDEEKKSIKIELAQELNLKLPDGRTITLNDEQHLGVIKIRKWLKSDNQFFTLAGYAGTGKEQPIDRLIQTPKGPIKIGNLKVGDEVFSSNGKKIKVNGVFPQGIKQAYKITFRDKTFTECGEDHLWNVWTKKLRQNNRPCKTMSLKEIIKSGLTRGVKKKLHNYSIPLTQPTQFDIKELPIHPYILGVLIGDGSLTGNTINISIPDMDSEIIEKIEPFLPKYIQINRNESTVCPRYNLVQTNGEYRNKFKQKIIELGLNVKSENKFIPQIYKYSSVEQRWELLRGLMDTDGTSRGNRIGFSTSSKQLRNDIIELVQSLGGVAIINKNDERHENINYSINIKTFENPFKIKRKAQNWKFSKKNPPSRYITSIEKSRICEQVCISVDSEDGLYLTDSYIATHNTTIIKKILDEYRGRVVVSAPTHKAKKVIMKTTECDGETLHALLGLRPDLDLDDFNPNDPIFNIIAPPKITNYNFIIIDEASMINEELFGMIKTQLQSWRTIKVLFMGDPAQIPPVGEKESIVFYTDVGEKHQLTQIMRQEDGNPLAIIYSDLRNNLLDEFGGIQRKTSINSKGEGITFTKSRKLFREKLFDVFCSKDYANDIDHAKLIAWRNITVMQSNQLIRNAIFGKNVGFLVKGDVLMAYRSVRAARQYYNLLDNSADYLVANVSKKMKNEFDLWGYKTTIKEKLPNGKDMHRNIFIVDHTDIDNLHNYAEIHDGLKLIAKNDPTKREWNKYYAFRRESLIMITIKSFRNGTSRIYSEVIAKDLDYGFAITCHKAQGSTYKHVFILEDDMSLNYKFKERNQIKYVALTRPTTTATVLTNLTK